jgi:hypothetical protein
MPTKSAPKPATADAPIKAQAVPVPVVTRTHTAAPNPYADLVGALKVGGGALAFTLPLPTGGDAAIVKMVAKTKRLLNAAGSSAVTVRSLILTDESGIHVTVWTVAKITRKPKA